MERNVLEYHITPPSIGLSSPPQRLCNLRDKFVPQLPRSLLLLSCRRRRCHLASTASANPSSLCLRHYQFRVDVPVAAVMSPLLPPIQFCTGYVHVSGKALGAPLPMSLNTQGGRKMTMLETEDIYVIRIGIRGETTDSFGTPLIGTECSRVSHHAALYWAFLSPPKTL